MQFSPLYYHSTVFVPKYRIVLKHPQFAFSFRVRDQVLYETRSKIIFFYYFTLNWLEYYRECLQKELPSNFHISR
jgi:hypothetical protein